MADPTEKEVDEILMKCRKTLKDVQRRSNRRTSARALGFEAGTRELPSTRSDRAQMAASFVDSTGRFIAEIPPASMTGVAPDMTRLCAAACGQIYRVTQKSQFSLSSEKLPEVQVLLHDTHGSLSETTPDFAVVHVPSEKTLLLVWKGSVSIMDWLHDVSFAPQGSCRFRKLSRNLKLHGGFCSISESELVSHEDYILDYIRQNDITQIICTGHSLGGGVATTCHFMLYYMLTYDSDSYWHQKLGAEIANAITVRCVAFSAPSTIVLLRNEEVQAVSRDATLSEEGRFLQTLSKYSCNFVYSQDPVPRLPAYLTFVDELVKDIIEHGAETQLPWYVRILPNVGEGQWVTSLYENWLSENTNDPEDSIKKLLSVALKFRHYATIIYYDTPLSEPLALKDLGPYANSDDDANDDDDNKGPSGKLKSVFKHLRQITYKNTPPKIDLLSLVLKNHMFLVTAPGLGYNIPNAPSTKTEESEEEEDKRWWKFW